MNIVKKNIILCADDYGLSHAISQAIIKLLQAQRLSAVSCLSTSDIWSTTTAPLKDFLQQASIGLHINFTEGVPLAAAYRNHYGCKFYSITKLIALTHMRKLNPMILGEECLAQLERFTTTFAKLPDFIDGHQHVHHLPQIRVALCQAYQHFFNNNTAYMRSLANQVPPQGFYNLLKQSIIKHTGAVQFLQILQQQAIPHNDSFAGVYNFNQTTPYSATFADFLAKIGNRGLIMCHPALPAPATTNRDIIAAARWQEYNYLSSQQFNDDCKAYAINLVKAP
jgi:predicted glycoside hydrolase/deacetylase ChbG (UPF0249 family)